MANVAATPFSVERDLRRHFEREKPGSRYALTLAQLLRSDADRLIFWTDDQVIDHYGASTMWTPDDPQEVAINIAARFPELTPTIGYSVEVGCRPREDAWLVTIGGHVVDPASERRSVVGFLGVALRAGEVARWTPTQPHAVAELDVHRLAVKG